MEESQTQTKNKNYLIPIFAIVAIDAVGSGIILPLLPFYSKNFGASPFTIGLLFATYAVCQFAAGPYLGKLSDRYGRKKVLILSQVGTLLSFLILIAARNLTMIFVARILDGLTSGNVSVAAALAADKSEREDRKQALGVVSAAIGVGLMTGPALSSLFSGTPSGPMWVAVALSFCSIVSTAFLLTGDLNESTPDVSTSAPKRHGLFHAVTEKRNAAVLLLLGLLYLVLGMFISELAIVLSARFSLSGHPFGARELGYAFTLIGAVNIFVQLYFIKVISRVLHDRWIVIASFGALAVGFLLIASTSNVGVLAGALFMCGLGSSLLRPTLMSFLSKNNAQNRQGLVMGVNQSLMAMMNVVGPLFAGVLINRGLYMTWASSAAFFLLTAAVLTFVFSRRGVLAKENIHDDRIAT